MGAERRRGGGRYGEGGGGRERREREREIERERRRHGEMGAERRRAGGRYGEGGGGIAYNRLKKIVISLVFTKNRSHTILGYVMFNKKWLRA